MTNNRLPFGWKTIKSHKNISPNIIKNDIKLIKKFNNFGWETIYICKKTSFSFLKLIRYWNMRELSLIRLVSVQLKAKLMHISRNVLSRKVNDERENVL